MLKVESELGEVQLNAQLSKPFVNESQYKAPEVFGNA